MKRPSTGCRITCSRISRMSSIPRWLAASISTTSREVPAAIVRHELQVLSGVAVGPLLAVERLGEDAGERGLPGPARARRRGRPAAPGRRSIALRSVRTTASWPTTSSKSWGGICGRARSRPAISAGAAAGKPGRAPPSRALSERCRRRSLGPGRSAAPERDCLALLPPGPDAVRRLPCAEPGRQRLRAQALPRTLPPREGVRPRWSGLRVQGTASSPPSATGPRDGSDAQARDAWYPRPRGA